MKILLTVVFVTLTTVFWSTCVVAQERQSASPQPDRTVGAAEVYYFKERNKSRAQVRIYLVGKPDDIGSSRESLSMDVIFEVDGGKVISPRYVTIALSSYSPDKPKYQKDHDLHIYTEGLKESSGIQFNTRLLSTKQLPSGGTLDIFLTPAIEYSKFLRMATAHLAIITFGEKKARVVLKKEDIKALDDLNRTIEK